MPIPNGASSISKVVDMSEKSCTVNRIVLLCVCVSVWVSVCVSVCVCVLVCVCYSVCVRKLYVYCFVHCVCVLLFGVANTIYNEM